MDVFKQLLYPQLQVLGFLTGRDSAPFRDNGTEVPSLSRDKGTTGQAQNLATGHDRTGQAGVKKLLFLKNFNFYLVLIFFLTEEFVPGFLLLPLSRDKVTMGQGNITSSRQTLRFKYAAI